MCGRTRLQRTFAELSALMRAEYTGPERGPRLEVRPTETQAVLTMFGVERTLRAMEWGLIPSWSKDRRMGAKAFNARVETVDVKPMFRDAWRKRRCVVLVDGFYEWSGEKSKRHPNLVRVHGDEVMALAGLWEPWKVDEANTLESCTILTTEAKGVMAGIHDRMPIVLRGAQIEAWLDPNQKDVRGCLKDPFLDFEIVPLRKIGSDEPPLGEDDGDADDATDAATTVPAKKRPKKGPPPEQGSLF
ncbi:MAG: SOS response-associated peptidase [Polyangiaceae bacterium]